MNYRRVHNDKQEIAKAELFSVRQVCEASPLARRSMKSSLIALMVLLQPAQLTGLVSEKVIVLVKATFENISLFSAAEPFFYLIRPMSFPSPAFTLAESS